jgi:hypothetical protein
MHFSPQTPRDAIPQMLAYAPLNTPFGRSASTREPQIGFRGLT